LENSLENIYLTVSVGALIALGWKLIEIGRAIGRVELQLSLMQNNLSNLERRVLWLERQRPTVHVRRLKEPINE